MTTDLITKGKHYINGCWSDGSENESFETINPATQEVIGNIPKAQLAEIESTYHFAKEAFLGWREYSRVQRAEYFLKLANLIEER